MNATEMKINPEIGEEYVSDVTDCGNAIHRATIYDLDRSGQSNNLTYYIQGNNQLTC